jgi:DNA-binding transcriptional regulator YbjK
MTGAAQVDTSAPDRRGAIADAAITIVARDGLRALTHRAVDRELELPTGSTSYYVRTRRQLIELVVQRLAGRTRTDLAAESVTVVLADSGGGDVPDAVLALARLVDRIAGRPADQLTRFALAVDLHSDPELHRLITSDSPVRQEMMAAARSLVSAAGATEVETAARGLLILADGLIFDRLVGSGVEEGHRADPVFVFGAYLAGISGTR